MSAPKSASIEQLLSDSRLTRFVQELFRNSGQFPIGIIFIEVLNNSSYMFKPDLYALILAAMLQAYWLSKTEDRPGWQRFIGNLIAPALYTAFEMSLDGWGFFESPHHIAYWLFAFVIGLLQAFQGTSLRGLNNILLIVENIVRAQILFAVYAIYESYTSPNATTSIAVFFSDPSHVLMLWVTLTLGLSSGLADVNARGSLENLRQTAKQLKVYSEWLLGRDLLGRAINDPQSMQLQQRERTILFMDIRGFTRWSETHTPAEVATLLDAYYMQIERELENRQVIKYKFTADEVMAVFLSPQEAILAARHLRDAMATALSVYNLGAGIGIHTGLLVEGLLGSKNLRFYDAIGDTVNTAQRIESAADAGEIWISTATFENLSDLTPVAQKEIAVKGKELPLKVYLIA
jgi:class 3 adenylate cyclase